MSDASRSDRLLDLARRLLSGEAIDWEKEGIAEEQVLDGMKHLQKILGRPEHTTETRDTPSPPEIPAPPPPPPAAQKREDRYIGDFRLVRKLGEGGMGLVYEAEQQHPRRPVALKVIRGGAHVSAETLKLFQREAQTLAHLRHPGIAALYETGATDDGLHFFAMELVRGSTLTAWLGQRPAGPLTPHEVRLRLSVFKKICDAVAYAHQKGVIHRDLKPANVLIPKVTAGSSMQDEVPGIKVLDFGLARITDSDVQATTYVTEMGKIQGTLPYMSPEQVRGNPDEIDLRTDVYSLGVMLYEIVTGTLPYDIAKAQIPEAVRIICEQAPKSISASFTGTRHLDADVITIAGKCLEKEPSRRYQSAAALGEDVQRYLSDQPILARPPSAAYQLKKLVVRHKAPFAAAAGALVLLVAFSITTAIQAVRIARERDRANQEAEIARRVSGFMESLFDVANPFAARDRELSAREVLDAGAERIETELKDQPAVQMRLLGTIGRVYDWGLGRQDRAEPLLKRSLQLGESLYGPESLEVADALNAVGGFGRGRDYHLRAHAIRSRLLAPDDPRMIRSFYHLGDESSLRQALTLAESSGSSDEQLYLWIMNDLALILADVHRDYPAAVALLRKAYAIRERIYGKDHPDRMIGMMNLGEYLMETGEMDEARRWLEPALASMERSLGPDHYVTAVTALYLGELERREGHFDRARSLLERTVHSCEAQIARTGSLAKAYNPGSCGEALHWLGLLDEAEHRQAEALDHLGRARQVHLQGLWIKDPSADYARVLRAAGRTGEAERVEAEKHVRANP
jgi:serine/threonine protein kinase